MKIFEKFLKKCEESETENFFTKISQTDAKRFVDISYWILYILAARLLVSSNEIKFLINILSALKDKIISKSSSFENLDLDSGELFIPVSQSIKLSEFLGDIDHLLKKTETSFLTFEQKQLVFENIISTTCNEKHSLNACVYSALIPWLNNNIQNPQMYRSFLTAIVNLYRKGVFSKALMSLIFSHITKNNLPVPLELLEFFDNFMD